MKPMTNAPQQHSSSGPSFVRAWSYSQLSAAELCPRKWASESFYKTIRQTEGSEQNYGKDVHKAFELRAAKGVKLPLDLQHHEPNIAKLLSIVKGERVVEQRIAINQAFEPTGFFDSDVWCRAVIDLMDYDENRALIVDWKTGKIRPDFDQLDLMAAMTQCLVPSLKKIVGAFYWTKERKVSTRSYPAASISGIWAKFMPRVERFQDMVREQDFPAKPNFLCRRHCGVSACPHWGVG